MTHLSISAPLHPHRYSGFGSQDDNSENPSCQDSEDPGHGRGLLPRGRPVHVHHDGHAGPHRGAGLPRSHQLHDRRGPDDSRDLALAQVQVQRPRRQ